MMKKNILYEYTVFFYFAFFFWTTIFLMKYDRPKVNYSSVVLLANEIWIKT